MRLRVCFSLFLTVLFVFHCHLVAASTLIQSVQILNIETGDFSTPMDVLIIDNKISEIGKNLSPNGAKVIKGNNRYLIPGLTEMHAHVPPRAISDEQRNELLFLYTAHGITTIRGMLGHPLHLKLQSQLNSNKIAGPRLITSGPSFNGRSVTTASFAKGRTTAQHQKGYDFIKVHPGMSAAVFKAMANQAQQLNFPFAGHITAEVGLLPSAHFGQASVDHLDGVMQSLAKRAKRTIPDDVGFFGSNLVSYVNQQDIAPLAKELAATGIAIVPTESLMYGFLSPQSPEISAQREAIKLMPAETISQWSKTRKSIHQNKNYNPEEIAQFFVIRKRFINEFVNHGGTLLLGSDAPQVFNVPGDAIHEEMALMQDAGLTPLQILQSATIKPATFFKQQNEFGSIEIGKSADVILLTENPLKDIHYSRNIAGVMTRGNWLPAEQIAKGLAQIKASHMQ